MIRQVHLVYPAGPGSGTPDAIGRNLGSYLAQRYEVTYHDWRATYTIPSEPDAALLGHPHPAPWTVFRKSARGSHWGRVLLLAPFNHDTRQVAYIDPFIHAVDRYLALAGSGWVDAIADSPFAHFEPKILRLDLAVDTSDFPLLKTGFNPPGSRSFLYIGHSGWTKNPGYLSALASALPDYRFSWIGIGTDPIDGVEPHGWHDMRSERTRALIAEHDFLVTVSRADANPTTILEAMAWGLLPVCTPQSGFVAADGVVNVPLDDVATAVQVLRALADAPEEELLPLQRANRERVETYYTWDRFGARVIEAIEDDEAPPVPYEPLSRKILLRWAALAPPNSTLSPANVALGIRALVPATMTARLRGRRATTRGRTPSS